ncbi:MAG: hypothetical protein H0V91_11185 [Flavisolibacter sp.]|nr:hypothetical protein [Flavisolibacter sp.]
MADEYLRLAYNGLRAKDPQDAVHKNFNAVFETHFDADLKPMEVVSQDIGRVFLNLFNNAFYTVNEKRNN